MALSAPVEDVLVTCTCGVETPVANRWMVDAVTCRGCGARLRMMPHNTRCPHETPRTAMMQQARNGDPAHQARMAARYVQEDKLDEAGLLYKEILQQDPAHRDALYGLGFICYKRGQITEALAALRQAVRLGHPHAMRLVKRIAERSSPVPPAQP